MAEKKKSSSVNVQMRKDRFQKPQKVESIVKEEGEMSDNEEVYEQFKEDEVMTLIDEDGNEYPTIYLARKTGLRGGWKGFAVAHDLADRDAVIFN